MEPIRYVAGILRNSHACYLLQFNNKIGGWVFPGGKIEPEETCAAALCRELAEELGVHVYGATLFRIITHEIAGKMYTGYYYIVTEYSDPVTNMEPDKCDKIIMFATRNHTLQLVRPDGPEAEIVRALEQ